MVLYPATSRATENTIQSGVHEDIPTRVLDAHMRMMEQMLARMNTIDAVSPIDNYTLFDEEMYGVNESTLSMTFNIDRPVLITSMMISIPPTTTGLLTIGDRINVPVQQEWLNPTGIAMIVAPNAKATMTLTGGSGKIMVRFMGNSLRNDKWRRL